jgi:hypothetical protein
MRPATAKVRASLTDQLRAHTLPNQPAAAAIPTNPARAGFSLKNLDHDCRRRCTHFRARRLMKPEEILTLMDEIQLLFVKNLRPFPAETICYFERPEFIGLFYQA